MHGLVNRAIQCFVRDTYGGATWERLAKQAEAPVAGFEALFIYDDEVTDRMIDAAEEILGRSRETILEDLGTYLVSHPNVGSLRRLLRFGGDTFVEFLQSVDDLPWRAALAVPDLDLPYFDVVSEDDGVVRVLCRSERPGFGHVLVGVIRTLADDYGALAILEHEGREGVDEWISVRVLSAEFSEGRPFQLAAES
ncbi:heme NO-binding protein [Rhodobacteraceae bacterium SC52]|nr:heme NO-binding protein [Rhodobacteraceae bacterium SC52]